MDPPLTDSTDLQNKPIGSNQMKHQKINPVTTLSIHATSILSGLPSLPKPYVVWIKNRAIICPDQGQLLNYSLCPTIHKFVHSRINERSHSFFALGIVKNKLHRPVVSDLSIGTAGANFYPAVIVSLKNRVLLLVLTAGSPSRNCVCARLW
jgi:hypothetical protein